MEYSFFIQKTRGPSGEFVDTFIMLPASNARAQSQSAVQNLVTKHRMHTCVNLPIQGTSLRFKGGHARMDGKVHPVLIILSTRDGAFRLPFEAGQEGVAALKKTYSGIQLAFQKLRNERLAKVGQARDSHKIGYAKTETVRVTGTTGTTRGTRDTGPTDSASKPAQAKSNAQHSQNVVYLRSAAQAEAQHPQEKRAPVKPPHRRKRPAPQPVGSARASKARSAKPANQPPTFIKWLAIGAGLSLMVLSIVYTGSAFANDNAAAAEERAAEDFAGFPVPETSALTLIKAKTASKCAFPGLDRSMQAGALKVTRQTEAD